MLNEIKIFIIEDDERSCENLKRIIRDNLPKVEIVGESSSVKESLVFLKNSMPDLLLMDIVLKDGEAFEILNQFPENTFDVIFITGHGQFVQRAFEYFAFNFLVKPFEDKDLISLINQFLNKRQKIFDIHRLMVMKEFLDKNGSKFLIHTGNEYLTVNINNIINCKADGNYTKFFFQNGKTILGSNPLKYYEQVLSYKGFFRVTRFDLINNEHVKSIYKKETIILSNDEKINVSLRNREMLVELMQSLNYM